MNTTLGRRSILFFLLLPTGEALAYKPAPPERHDVHSPNGAFVLNVDPKTNRFTIYAAGNRNQPLWSFNRSTWWAKYFISNDGNVAAVRLQYVSVEHIDDGKCIEFWNKTGKFKEFSFAELCPHPARNWFDGPSGTFWRTWYSQADLNGATLTVRTTDEFEYAFAMDDGRILETTRIGLPWWLWWALMLFSGIIAVFLFIRRRRKKIAQIA